MKKLKRLELVEYESTEECPEGRLVIAYFEEGEEELTKDWGSFPLSWDPPEEYKGLSRDIGRFLKWMGKKYSS